MVRSYGSTGDGYDCEKYSGEGSSLGLGEDVRVLLIVLTVFIVFLALAG